jgi:hypothetical protein
VDELPAVASCGEEVVMLDIYSTVQTISLDPPVLEHVTLVSAALLALKNVPSDCDPALLGLPTACV